MSEQPGQAPLCPRCDQHRDVIVHLEQYRQNSIGYHPYTDATSVTVTFVRKLVPDPHPDLSYLTQKYTNVPDAATREKCKAQDAARLAAYNNEEWACIGVLAEARIEVKRPGWTMSYELMSPGLWGVENDGTEDYLNSIFTEEKSALKADIEAIMSLAQFGKCMCGAGS